VFGVTPGGQFGKTFVAGLEVVGKVVGFHHLEAGVLQRLLVGIEAEVGVVKETLVNVLAGVFTDFRVGLGQVIETKAPPGAKTR
jgi:hypothetical protein